MPDTFAVPRMAVLAATVIATAVLLTACGAKKKEVTQAAARVDGSEITVHQINFRLQRERGLRPEQMDAASHRVLEQLIDEQLLVEKAEKDKLDKDPLAQQAIDAAHRDVLARSYVEQVAQAVPAPTDDLLHRYFDNNDALFTHRRIYTLHEFLARVPADKIPALKAIIDAGQPATDITAWLKGQNFPFREQQGVHPAEQIPLASLNQVAALQDGHGMLASAGDQVHITYAVSSNPQPVTYDAAKRQIAVFLSTESRRKATESNLGALRSAAKIEYAPQYAALAASQPALTTRDIEASASMPQATNGTHISLPDAGTGSGVQVSLPTTTTSGVQVSLPVNTTPGVRVSLPTAASSVEVRLPPQTGGDAGKK